MLTRYPCCLLLIVWKLLWIGNSFHILGLRLLPRRSVRSHGRSTSNLRAIKLPDNDNLFNVNKPTVTSDPSVNIASNNYYPTTPGPKKSIVIIAGFEKFNFQLYQRAIDVAGQQYPDVNIFIFTDNDISERPEVVEKALQSSKALLCSLIFDYPVVQWIKKRIQLYQIPVRFCFESALELMSDTAVGEFSMNAPSGGGEQRRGMPAPVKVVLNNLFGTSSREEDKLAGYLKLLKIGPKLLQWIPPNVGGSKLSGLRTWINVYSYWTESGVENIASMLRIIIQDLDLAPKGSSVTNQVLPALVETPPLGLFHPLLQEEGRVITSPRDYVSWYTAQHPWVNALTPRVGVLLYRKHVISEQGYIGNLINLMENEGIMPIPVYINGVEGHTVVRDLFTSNYEDENSLFKVVSYL